VEGAREHWPSLEGEVVVFVPVRDRCIIVGSQTVEPLGAALELARELYEPDRRRISPAPYALTTSRLEPWRPEADHPLSFAADRAHHLLAQVEYDEQTARLSDLFERAGEPVHVAALLTGAHEAKRTVRSYAVWSRSTQPALLPTADLVVLGEGQDQFEVGWEDAVRVAGPWLVRQSLEPVRWRVDGWPPDTVLDELRALGRPFLA
jgi:hypothetical protein